MIATVCADGTDFSSFFVIKGKYITYVIVDIDNIDFSEDIFELHPPCSLVSVLEFNTWVDKHNVANWATRLVEHVKPNNDSGR